MAWWNKDLIQNHNFWEVKSGDKAIFWEDSWQQMQHLVHHYPDQAYHTILANTHLSIVRDLWDITNPDPLWRHWLPLDRWPTIPKPFNEHELWVELLKRKIHISQASDRLRWGYKPIGSYY